ncbi:MAG: hypothetical protein IKK39_00890 [Thermoguttaceae bacterium]|nr:hypothetical protein [Thermoguttaceae bacterium]
MSFCLKSFWSVALFVALGTSFNVGETHRLFAQDAPNAETPAENPAPEEKPAPAEAPAPEEKPAPAEAPAPEEKPAPAPPAPNPAAVLEMERAAKAKTPEIFAKLASDKTFSRRIPNYWNALKLTKRQKNAIYALQLEYFTEIAQLQARIERLEAERDARYREILTQKQKEALDAKLAEVEKSRAAKAEAKEAAEEAEAEAEIR